MSANPNGSSIEEMDAWREVEDLRHEEHDKRCAKWDRDNESGSWAAGQYRDEAERLFAKKRGIAHAKIWEEVCNQII